MATPSSNAPSISLCDGRHLVPGPAIEYGDLGAQTPADPGRVDSGVPAADHNHFASHLQRFAAIDVVKKFDAGQNVAGVFARHAEFQPLMGADADEDGFAFLPQLLERDILPHDDAALQLDAEIQDPLYFRIQDFAGQAVFGNAIAQHAVRAD